MSIIPIAFDHQDNHYKGVFSEVHGAGANVWHLSIDNYYYGQLMLTPNGWAFYGSTMEDLAEYFGEYITLWYE